MRGNDPNGMNRGPGGRPISKIDPHSDKFAFFKDNIRDEEESFDPHQYYYNRQEKDHLAHSEVPRQQQPVYPGTVKKPETRQEPLLQPQQPQQIHHPKPVPYQQQQLTQQQQYQQQQYQQYQQQQQQHKAPPQQQQPQQPQQRHVQHVPVSPAKQNPNQRSAVLYNTCQPVINSKKEDGIPPVNLNTSSGGLSNSNNNIINNVLPISNSSLSQSNGSVSNNNIANAPILLQNMNVNNNNSPLNINNMNPNNNLNTNIPMNILNPPPSSIPNSSSFNNLNINNINPNLTISNPSNNNNLNNNISNSLHNSNGTSINLNNINNINPPIVSPISSPTSATTSTAPSLSSSGANDDQYDLLGLLKVLKMTNLNLNILAFGTDLTTLGLNLSSTEVLYNSFASPYSTSPLKQEPDHIIPECYFINPALSVPTDKMNLFSDETLFYIFYGMPNDVLQVAAAVELAARDWSYHTELRVWFQRLPGTTPLVKALNYETGSYIYFDIHQWKDKTKTNFQMEYDKLYSPKT
jgi:CCR4-NOT transcription complex subunit 2